MQEELYFNEMVKIRDDNKVSRLGYWEYGKNQPQKQIHNEFAV